MRKPRVRAAGYFEDGRNKYESVLNGKVSPEKYIESRQDTASRNILQCPELYLLRLNYNLYRRFLLLFSFVLRRLVLLKYEVTGFRQNELYSYYGIHFDLIRRFVGNVNPDKSRYEVKVKIRKINLTDDFSKQFLASVAILCRVPVEWLEANSPKMKWSIKHFHDLSEDAFFKSGEQFVEYLLKLNKRYHDVQGIVVDHGDIKLYIRLENWFGSFIVEMFNPMCPAREYLVLRKLLSPFNPVEGYMPTIIESQMNYAFVCYRENSKPVCLPVEFVQR